MKIKSEYYSRILSFLLSFILSFPAFSQWDSIQLPCRPNISTLQAWQGSVFATSTNGTVYESKDHGAAWDIYLNRAPGFILNPADSRTYWFYNNTTLLFSTYPGSGSSAWNIQVPFAETYFRSGLSFSNDTVYVFNGHYLHRIVPMYWQPVSVPLPADFYINHCFVFGQHIWADNYAVDIHSSDGGVSWDTVATDPQNRLSLAAASDTILMGYFDVQQQTQVLARTRDQGQNWEIATQAPVTTFKGGRPFLGYDSNNQQAYYSWNGLTDWQPVDTEFLPNTFTLSGGVKIAGQQFGVQYENNGQWSAPSLGVGVPNEMAYTPIYLRKANDLLLFGGDGGGYGLYKRFPGSNAWTKDVQPYFADRTVQIGNQLIGCGKYGTYRAQLGSPDFNWVLLNAQTGYLFEMNGMLYLGDANNSTIYRSLDAGQTWIQTGTSPSSDFVNSFVAYDGKFFMRSGADLMVSENEGQTWSKRYTFQLTFDIPTAAKLNALDSHIFLSHVETQQILTSDDDGTTFSTLMAPQNLSIGTFRLRVFSNQLFLYNGDGKLYRSTDLGQSWKTVKPPYYGFDFDPGMVRNTMFVDDAKMYLFDPSKGAAWVADLANLEPNPCDGVFIDLPEYVCDFSQDIPVVTPAGMLYTWYEDGTLIQQNGNNYFPFFQTNNGSTYQLVISDPVSGCSVSGETTVKSPIAKIGYLPVMPCDQEFQTLDLSGSSHYPGIQQNIYRFVPDAYYQYSNSFDASGQPSNPDPPVVESGFYILQIYDSELGCFASDTADIKHEIENPIADLQTTPASCGQSDGTANVQFTSDPALTTIDWSNGASGATVTGLAPGWYSVTVSQEFCSEKRNFLLEEDLSCKVRIRGKVWNDSANPDCLQDGNTFSEKAVLLRLLPDSIYTFTDDQGNYEFVRSPGDYTVEFIDNDHFDVLCPASGSFPVSLPDFGSLSEGNDFFVEIKPAKNLSVTVGAGQAVPGFPLEIDYWVSNFGDIYASDVSVIFQHDPALSGIDPPFAFTTYYATNQTAVSENIYLSSGSTYGPYSFSMQIPPDIPVGTVLHFSMDILPSAGDLFPADNHVEWSQTVVASFDPNDKQVSPGDNEWGGKIFEKDTLLRYTVHFQNTGNHPATTVEIRDTLDPNLDVSTLQPGGSSHPYFLQWRFEGQNVLVLRFENIYLPDSSSHFEMSQGFVTFSVKRKQGLPIGTRIRNRAGILFDYNAPVITNTVESVLSAPVGTVQMQAMQMPVRVYPNPGPGIFTIELPQPTTPGMRFLITDLTGRLVLENAAAAGTMQQIINATNLPAGLYLLQVVSEGKVQAVEKLVKN